MDLLGLKARGWYYELGDGTNALNTAESQDIRKAQMRLQYLGYIGREVTSYGYFGAKTKQAVIEFQYRALPAGNQNGRLGDMTWHALGLMLDEEAGPDTPISYIDKYRKTNTYPSVSEEDVNSIGRGDSRVAVRPGLECLQDILPDPINYHTWADSSRVTIWKDWSRNEADGKIGVYWADNENIQILNGETYGKREFIETIVANYRKSQQPTVQHYTRQQLEVDLDRLSSNELGIKGIAALRSTSEALSIIFNYDSKITDVASSERMNKAIMQAALFRELRWYGTDDIIADNLVVQTYYYRLSCEDYQKMPPAQQLVTKYPEPPIGMRDDSSTGLGQIFAKTAIEVTNWRYGTNYDFNDWHTLRDFWYKLRDDDMYNLEMVGTVLAWGAGQKNVLIDTSSETGVKAILARYNGLGDAAVNHGEKVYEYYLLFLKYNESN